MNYSTYIVAPGSRRLIIGPMVEFRLPQNWSVEVDALHRELRSTTTTLLSPGFELPDGSRLTMIGPFTRTHTTWEFPMLAKYRIPVSKLNAFVALGPSLRPAGTGTGLSHLGIAAGAGVEMQLLGINLAPTLRYTRWSAANRSPFGGAILNQVEFLVGFHRPSTSASPSAFGRKISIGAIVGLGLGRDFRPPTINPFARVPESNSPIAGAMVEFGLPKNLSVEIDGLYRPLHGSDGGEGGPARFATLTWEFPVLLKYRFRVPRVKPFVELGPSFRALGNVVISPPSHYGVTAGAGVEINLRRLKVSPTIRYSRWAAEQQKPFGTYSFPNQTQLLVGFSF